MSLRWGKCFLTSTSYAAGVKRWHCNIRVIFITGIFNSIFFISNKPPIHRELPRIVSANVYGKIQQACEKETLIYLSICLLICIFSDMLVRVV